jgi:signal peptidase II
MKKILSLGIAMFILDQFTKFLVDKFVDYGSCINIIPFFNFFNITNVRNTGITFGMFKGNNLLFSLLVFLFLIIISLWLYKNWIKIHKTQKYAFCLIISGGLGNLIDRLLRNEVVDFLDFGINYLRWPSFNIADSCIFVAMVLIFADILNLKRKTFTI